MLSLSLEKRKYLSVEDPDTESITSEFKDIISARQNGMFQPFHMHAKLCCFSNKSFDKCCIIVNQDD